VSTSPPSGSSGTRVSEESPEPSNLDQHAKRVSPHLCAASRARGAQTTRRLKHAVIQKHAHPRAELANARHLSTPLNARMRPCPLPPRGTSARALASHPSPLGCPVLVHPLAQALSYCGGVSSSRGRYYLSTAVVRHAVAECCGPAPRHGRNHDMHLFRTEVDPVPAAARPGTSVCREVSSSR